MRRRAGNAEREDGQAGQHHRGGQHEGHRLAERQRQVEQHALDAGNSDRSSLLTAQIAAIEAQLLVLQAAYTAQTVFGALEDAYRRPLQGEEGQWLPAATPQS